MEKKLVVAYGKSLTSKKGIVSEGEAVDETYFVNEEVYKDLQEKGFIVTWGDYKKSLHLMGLKGDAELAYKEEPEPEPELKLGGAKKKAKKED